MSPSPTYKKWLHCAASVQNPYRLPLKSNLTLNWTLWHNCWVWLQVQNSTLLTMPQPHPWDPDCDQNSAARLLTKTKIRPHIIQDTRWILLLTNKALHGKAHLYKKEMICPLTSGRCLRSRLKVKTSSDRAFAGALWLWNSFLQSLRGAKSVSILRKQLKT